MINVLIGVGVFAIGLVVGAVTIACVFIGKDGK